MKLSLLGRNLWEHGIVWDMPSFLSAYTLHDSSLEETRLAPGPGMLMIFAWDLYWNRAISPSYDLLAIRVNLPYYVAWRQGEDTQPTVDDAISGLVPEADRERLFTEIALDLGAYRSGHGFTPSPQYDRGLTHTVVDLMNGSRLEILHTADVRFVCFNDKGEAGDIPYLPPRSK